MHTTPAMTATIAMNLFMRGLYHIPYGGYAGGSSLQRRRIDFLRGLLCEGQ